MMQTCKGPKFLFIKVTQKVSETFTEFQVNSVFSLRFILQARREIQGYFELKRNKDVLNFLTRFLVERVLFAEFMWIVGELLNLTFDFNDLFLWQLNFVVRNNKKNI